MSRRRHRRCSVLDYQLRVPREKELTAETIRLTNGITDGNAEGKENDDTDSVESHTENQVSNDPSVVESSDNEYELGNNVDYDADEREEEVGDEKTGCLFVRHACVSVERRDGDKEAYSTDSET